MVEGLGSGLLGRHVGRRAEGGPWRGLEILACFLGLPLLHQGERVFLRCELREPEVQDLHLAGTRHEDVGGRHVAVDDAGGVGRIERVGHLAADVDDLRQRQGRLFQAVAQRLPVEQLHDEEGLRVAEAELVNRADVRVVERRRGPGLAFEPEVGLPVVRVGACQELDRHMAAEREVERLVDLSHPAAAQPAEHAVMRERLADHTAPATTRPSLAGSLAGPRCPSSQYQCRA